RHRLRRDLALASSLALPRELGEEASGRSARRADGGREGEAGRAAAALDDGRLQRGGGAGAGGLVEAHLELERARAVRRLHAVGVAGWIAIRALQDAAVLVGVGDVAEADQTFGALVHHRAARRRAEREGNHERETEAGRRDAALAVVHLLSFADADAGPARSRLLRTVRLHRAGAGLRGYDHGRHERRDRDEADVPDGRVRAGEDLAHRGRDRTLRAVVRLRAGR